MLTTGRDHERRGKRRFPLRRQLRYTIREQGKPPATGAGMSTDMSSSGMQFTADRELPLHAYIEISLSWPVTLANGCPLQLVARGRIVRTGMTQACTIRGVGFRTQSRVLEAASEFAGLGLPRESLCPSGM